MGAALGMILGTGLNAIGGYANQKLQEKQQHEQSFQQFFDNSLKQDPVGMAEFLKTPDGQKFAQRRFGKEMAEPAMQMIGLASKHFQQQQAQMQEAMLGAGGDEQISKLMQAEASTNDPNQRRMLQSAITELQRQATLKAQGQRQQAGFAQQEKLLGERGKQQEKLLGARIGAERSLIGEREKSEERVAQFKGETLAEKEKLAGIKSTEQEKQIGMRGEEQRKTAAQRGTEQEKQIGMRGTEQEKLQAEREKSAKEMTELRSDLQAKVKAHPPDKPWTMKDRLAARNTATTMATKEVEKGWFERDATYKAAVRARANEHLAAVGLDPSDMHKLKDGESFLVNGKPLVWHDDK